MWYGEALFKTSNAGDRTFYDANKLDLCVSWVKINITSQAEQITIPTGFF